MKKFLLPAALLLVAGTASAAQANVYASQLKTDGSTVSMILNTDADSVTLEVLDDAGNVVGTADLGAGVKGLNTFNIMNVKGDLTSGDYNYRVTCKAAAVTEPIQVSDDEDPLLQISNTRGVAVDVNPASPFFGRIYATSIEANAKNGARKGTGLYILGADGSDVTGQGDVPYQGGETWAGNSSPMRPSVAANGDVYVCDWSDGHSGVWVMNPAAPEEAWRAVFGGTRNGDGLASENGVNIHGSVNSVFTLGEGEDLKMFTIDEDCNADGKEHLHRYDLGTQTIPWVAAPSKVYDVFKSAEGTILLTNANQDCVYDAHGGAYISQYRYEADAYPSVCHINLTTGEFDYTSLVDGKEGVFNGSGPVGTMGASVDGKYVVVPNVSKIQIAEATYDENGVPSLEKKYDVPLSVGARPFGVAFDAAGNLYIANNDHGSGIVIFALPKEENSFTTPANDKITLEITGVTNVAAGAAVAPVYFDAMGRVVANPEAGKLYIERRGDKVSKVIL